jgi:RNA recognition motif-containing protein
MSPRTCTQDHFTGKARGIGFVEFTSSRDANAAVRGMHRTMLLGREIGATLAEQVRPLTTLYGC